MIIIIIISTSKTTSKTTFSKKELELAVLFARDFGAALGDENFVVVVVVVVAGYTE
eukprot:Awhi_evm1s4424